MSLDLVVDHHFDYSFRVIHYFLESHVDLDLFQHLGFIVDFLDVLKIHHNRGIVNRKRNVLDVDQDLIDRSVVVAPDSDLLHDGVNQYFIHLLSLDMKLVLLIVQFIQNAFQISN